LRAVLLESNWSVCFLATGSILQAGSVLFAMASRFPEVDDNAIQELIISSEIISIIFVEMTSPVERKIETLTDTQRRRKVTWEELYTHLYGHHDIETVDPEEIRIKRTRRTSRASEEETAGL